MRIFDINDIELFGPDLSLGRLEPDKLFVAHHDAVEAVEEVWHYELNTRNIPTAAGMPSGWSISLV